MPSTKTVLVVDDHDDTRYMLSTAITRLGYRTVEASNGNEGLEIIEAAPVDVVLTDVVMDGLDGFELLGLVRARRPQVKFVVMTGHVPSIARAYRSGLPVLLKPFSLQDVRGALVAALPESAGYAGTQSAIDEVMKALDDARDADMTAEHLRETIRRAGELLDAIVAQLADDELRQRQDILAVLPVLQAKLSSLATHLRRRDVL